MGYIIAFGNHTYIWGVTGQNPLLLKHTISLSAPSASVIKAAMHHQYRPNNLEKLHGAQHYTYGYKVQLLLRVVGRLERCEGVLSPQKGHLGPKTISSFSMVLLIACQVYIPFGVYGQSHVLTLGQFIF